MNGLLVLVLSLWLTLANSSYLPKKIPRKPLVPKIKLPEEVMTQGHMAMPELQIPNEKFCKQMQLQPYRHYMILPWWYVYCESILEREEKLIREKKKLRPIYGKILKMVQQYKKKKAHIEALQRQL